MVELARLDLGKVQDVVDQREQGIRGALDHAQIFALLGVSSVSSASSVIPMIPFIGRANFMAHVGQELTLGLAGGFGFLNRHSRLHQVHGPIRAIPEQDHRAKVQEKPVDLVDFQRLVIVADVGDGDGVEAKSRSAFNSSVTAST